ncbi:MAG TPA: hypothetical protein VHV08_16760 [Pirellulales bacterium]|jgi:hypothetical protein|nr:hypothetical protein [Pirellulales bacterium]
MADLKWMVGRSIVSVALARPSLWVFGFDSVGAIAVETSWRILKGGRIVLSNEDHGQRFGLPTAIDARIKATELLSALAVSGSEVREGTLDLFLEFAGGFRLEVLPISSGYESWQIIDPGGRQIFAQGGGNLVEP